MRPFGVIAIRLLVAAIVLALSWFVLVVAFELLWEKQFRGLEKPGAVLVTLLLLPLILRVGRAN